jgi:hypothetical protein
MRDGHHRPSSGVVGGVARASPLLSLPLDLPQGECHPASSPGPQRRIGMSGALQMRSTAVVAVQEAAAMNNHAEVGWILLILRLVLVGAGLLWVLVPSLSWLGRLPGDIRVVTPRFRFTSH